MSSELPNGWIETPLETLAADTNYPIGDGDHGQIKPATYTTSGIPYIRVGDMGWGKIEPKGLVYIPELVHELNLKSELLPGDILIAKTGATIGKCCIVPDSIPRANTTSSVGKVTINQDATSPKWILYNFLSRKFNDQMWAVSHKTAQPGFNIRDLKQFTIPLAPFAEQRRIVAKLEKLLGQVDACQQRLEKLPTLLKRFRQSILAAACSGRLTADCREENSTIETAEVLLSRIKEKRLASAQSQKEKAQIAELFDERNLRSDEGDLGLNEIPNTWLSCRIGAIGKVCNGSTPSRKQPEFWDGPIPWVSSGEVRNNVISETRERITKAGYEGSSVRLLPKGSVLIAMIGEGKTRGQTAILSIEATINQNIAAVVLDHGLVASEYLWRWFQLQYEATRERGSGSGPQALNCQRVRELPFILPPQAEQKEIVRRVEGLFALADQLEVRLAQAHQQVDKLTPSLIARAFAGKLVPQDPTDEPAEKLLARLRATQGVQKGNSR